MWGPKSCVRTSLKPQLIHMNLLGHVNPIGVPSLWFASVLGAAMAFLSNQCLCEEFSPARDECVCEEFVPDASTRHGATQEPRSLDGSVLGPSSKSNHKMFPCNGPLALAHTWVYFRHRGRAPSSMLGPHGGHDDSWLAIHGTWFPSGVQWRQNPES